jgi:uncharacterized protein
VKSRLDFNKIKKEIIARLSLLEPEKVILFGSYANGTATEDSDIDLYIVTKDDFIPKNWKEKSSIYLTYSNTLRSLQKEIPIDIIVHTRKMYEHLKNMNNSFYKYSIRDGMEL